MNLLIFIMDRVKRCGRESLVKKMEVYGLPYMFGFLDTYFRSKPCCRHFS